jgi:hypothetical protein
MNRSTLVVLVCFSSAVGLSGLCLMHKLSPAWTVLLLSIIWDAAAKLLNGQWKYLFLTMGQLHEVSKRGGLRMTGFAKGINRASNVGFVVGLVLLVREMTQ